MSDNGKPIEAVVNQFQKAETAATCLKEVRNELSSMTTALGMSLRKVTSLGSNLVSVTDLKN